MAPPSTLGQPVLLLGMHRSGTSVATRLLTLLGLSTPAGALLPADEDNPLGYWESQDLTDFDDKLLETLGSTWFAPPTVDEIQVRLDELEPLLSEAYEQAARAFARPGPTVWKDPRTCLLLPFWFQVLGPPGPCVIVHRDPLEVADSILRRNGFPVQLSLALWERHMRGALLATVSRRVHIEDYAALVEDPAGWTARVGGYLSEEGVDVQPPSGDLAAELLTPRSVRGEGGVAAGTLSAQQHELLALLRRLRGSSHVLNAEDLPPETPVTALLLDQARHGWSLQRDLDQARRAHLEETDALHAEQARLRDLEQLHSARTGEWEQRLEQLDAEVKTERERALTAERALQEERVRADALQSALEAQQAQATVAERTLVAERAAHAEQRARGDELAVRLEQVSHDLAWARGRVSAIESSTAWRATAPIRAAGEVKRAVVAHPAGQVLRLLVLLVSGRLPAHLRRRKHRRLLSGSALFDEQYYMSAYPDVPAGRALDHYLAHGSAEGRRPNRVFDGDWYVSTYPDVAATGLNPLLHYALAGAAEGRDPSPAFSSSYYLATNDDVRHSGSNPLAHYLLHGQEEGRLPRPQHDDEGEGEDDAPAPTAPSAQEWEAVLRPPGQAEPDVVVVVPVYRGFAETLRCLYSVLTSPVKTPYRLIVVDDASPEPEISAELRRLASRGLFELVVNAENGGFVKSVNRGMRLAGGRDVVLLNSDAEVYGDWLDRLRSAAWRSPRCGTVTPLTNSGTIASYPRFVRDNASALEVDGAALDRLAAEALQGETVEMPTCVGFCVYLRHDCLAEVGLFDEKAFGFGYGEENDFSLRAAARGWSNELAADVFVRHHGSTSFGETAAARQRIGLEVLHARYPDYGRVVARHISEDPAGPLRRRLDLARLQQARDGRPSLLLVSHALGGGTTRHVEDLARQLEAEGVLPLVLRPDPDGRRARLTSPAVRAVPNLVFPLGTEDPDLLATLRLLDVRHVHVHHLQGYTDGATSLPRLARQLGVAFDVTLHDWMTVCPRITMVDHTRRFCGGPAPDKCRACIARNGSPFGRPDAAAWQAEHSEFLRSARKVFAPSDDAARRFLQLLPGLEITVAPHPEPTPAAVDSVEPPADGLLHVAVLGAVSVSKGSEVLLALAQDAQRRRLPLRFHVFGYTNADAAFRDVATVSMTGEYDARDLPSLVRSSGCRIALFPAVWPETFSYTLSEAVDLGLEPVAFDIGAIAGRMRELSRGMVLPWEFVDRPGAVNDRLLAVEAPAKFSPRQPASYVDLLADYYALELDDAVVREDVAVGR
jgi:GT2 family glycosyltransferase